MKIVVFRHMFSGGLGSLGAVLDKEGLAYHYVDCWHEDLSGFDALGPDLLIVMGGAPGVYQADTYPFIKQETEILGRRLAQDLPTLGVCLGAQMMAASQGGAVYPGPKGKEKGWFPLKITEKGKKTPARHLDGALTYMAQWHGDTFDLPAGADLLASSEMYENQVFSWRKNGLGLQCHAEATPIIVKAWTVSSASEALTGTIDPAQMRADTEKHCATLMAQTEKFMSEWLGQVRENIKARHA